nr:molybdenum cofactor biosynthesis protein MoaE [Bacillus subtilis]
MNRWLCKCLLKSALKSKKNGKVFSAAITHRIGVLDIGEAAVVIAVSSPHRKAAYEANEYAIERIKQIVPIWKKEIWEDGEQWIGDQLETTAYPNGKPDLSEGEQHD